jgi:hypothetical protein
MIKKMSVLAAVVGAAGLGGAVAQASASHSVNQKGEGAEISHVPGKTTVFAGTLGSNGAIIEKLAFTSSAQTSFGGTVTVFGPKGSYRGTITKGTQSASQGGPPQKATEKVKVTAGHGLYKGATGSLTVTHTYINGSPGYYTIVVKGTIKY